MLLFNLESKPSSSIWAHLALYFLSILFLIPFILDLKFYYASQSGVAKVVGEYIDPTSKYKVISPIVDLQTAQYKIPPYKMIASKASNEYQDYIKEDNELAVRFTMNAQGQINEMRIDSFRSLWSLALYSFLMSLFWLLCLCSDRDGCYWIKYLILKKMGKVQLAQIIHIKQKVCPHSQVYVPTKLEVSMPFSTKRYQSICFNAKEGHPFKNNQMIEVIVLNVGWNFYLVKLHE